MLFKVECMFLCAQKSNVGLLKFGLCYNCASNLLLAMFVYNAKAYEHENAGTLEA